MVAFEYLLHEFVAFGLAEELLLRVVFGEDLVEFEDLCAFIIFAEDPA